MTKKINISIIIVTYNSADQINDLLDSIKKNKTKLTKEVIIVDNASQDNSVQLIKAHPLKTIFIKSNVNLGFSKAVNLALHQAKGEFVFLLNPDTRLIGSCLDKLFEFATKHSPLGAVAPCLLDPNGKLQPSVFYFPTITNAIRKYFLNQNQFFGKYLPTKSPAKVEVAVMAAFFMPRLNLQIVGLLSEKFFMYYEDVDYCRRLAKLRLPIYYLKEAKVEHVHGASGHFKSHFESPLAKSAQIYHGRFYSYALNLCLWLGQKYQKIWHRK